MILLATPLAGMPQTRQPNETATNLPGTTTIAAPPQGFDPLTASDEDLQYYGFPPRPDQNDAPDAYANWSKAMAASKTRIFPALQQTNISHGPVKLNKNVSESSQEIDALESTNWSGYLNLSGGSTYGKKSFYYIESDFVVPVANQAFGACTGDWDYGSSWVGIDGDGSSDVLQAGVEFDAYCSGGSPTAFYSPWYEWFPFNEVRITNLPIAPGDDYFVEVWHTSQTQGFAYLVNENTNQAVEIAFTAPSGTKLVGNSAEWILERPGVNGSLATLTNYVADPFWGAVAASESKVTYDPGSSSSKSIIMLDNNNKPISFPTKLSSTSFLMQDEGSAK